MSEKFYWKKQRLARRDKLLEGIGRTVFAKDQLPESFADLPRVFRLKDQLLDQLRDRKTRLRDARSEAIGHLETLEREAANIEQEFEEKLRPFKQQRDREMLRYQHAEDLAAKGGRQQQQAETAMEDLSCKVSALELRIQAGEKHRREKIGVIEKEARPLREQIARQNQMFGKALNEEEHLKMERLGRLMDVGYFFYSQRRDPETFESQYAALDKLIDELADYRTGRQAKVEVLEDELRENYFWKGLLAAIAVAAVIALLFRTQYREGQINFAAVAAKLLPSDQDHRLYMDLNQVGLESWYDEIPPLESLPGGSFFSGMARKDILAFMISSGELGESVRFCGVKLRQSPARAAYRLGQQGWKRVANQSGFQTLAKDNLMWVLLSDREFVLIPRDALAQLETLSTIEDQTIFRLEQKVTPFESNQAILQDLDRMELTLNSETFLLDLKAAQALPDATLRKNWLVEKLKKNSPNAMVDISFENDRLRLSGAYEPDHMPFHKDGIKGFITEQLKPVLRSLPMAKQSNPISPKIMAIPVPLMDVPLIDVSPSQGVMLLQNRDEGLTPIHQLAVGKALTQIVFLDKSHTALVVDAGEMSLHQVHLHEGRLKILATIPLNAKAMNEYFGTGSTPFIPSKIYPTPAQDFALVLEGLGGHTGRRRLMLMDLQTFRPVALEELPSSVKRPLAAIWGESGHDVYVGTEVFPKAKGGATRVLGFHRQGHILALSSVIRANPAEGRGGVSGLLFRPNHHDLFLRHAPSQTLVRYEFSEGSWQMDERLALDPEPNVPISEQGYFGRTMAASRNFGAALLLDRRSQIPVSDQYKLFALDLDPQQLRVIHHWPLPGKPASLLRIPLSDDYLVTLPGENAVLTMNFNQAAGQLTEMTNLTLEDFSPSSMTSDAFGEFIWVTGIFKGR